jgi:hypothetical protein
MAGDFKHKELSGSLFKNDRKTAANQPDYRGDCLIDGQQYWVSGWIKDGARGKWMSLAFTSKEAKPAPTAPDLNDEDVPF